MPVDIDPGDLLEEGQVPVDIAQGERGEEGQLSMEWRPVSLVRRSSAPPTHLMKSS